MRLARRWVWFTVLVVVLSAAQGLLWRWLAPAAECYADKGECFYQVSASTSPYFARDLTFAGLALLGAVITGLFIGRTLARTSLIVQVAVALALSGAQFAVAKLAVVGSATMVEGSRGIDHLSLRTVAFILVWPFVVQLIAAFWPTRREPERG